MPGELVEWGGYCQNCQQHRLFRATIQKPNHVLHAILTIFTCFLWGVVWLLAANSVTSSLYRCTVCGVPWRGGQIGPGG
jgi:hypothetical protein